VHAIDQGGVIRHLRQALADFRPLRAQYEFYVVGGDFKLSRNYDTSRRPPTPRSSPNSHTAFLEDVLAGTEGLVDCHRRFNAVEQQTFFSPRTSCKLQDDHLFVSSNLDVALIDCKALPWPRKRHGLSDHAPLLTEFKFS
jgi:exonuclease III